MIRRALIEAFKYFTLREILTKIALVSPEWQKSAYSGEILLIFLSNEPEADPISDLDFYQRIKEAKRALRYVLHISEGEMLVWHLVEPNAPAVSYKNRIYKSSSRYVMTSYNRAMVTGGEGREKSCMIVDVKSGKLLQRAAMLRKHAWHGIALMGFAVIVSGGDLSGEHARYAEKFEKGRWMDIANMTTPRYNHTLCRHQKRVYAFGGSHETVMDSIEYYDGSYWTLTPLKLPNPAECVSAISVKAGLLLVSGISSSDSNGSIYRWEEAKQQWEDLRIPVAESSLSNAVAVRNGCICIYSQQPAQVRISIPFIYIA